MTLIAVRPPSTLYDALADGPYVNWASCQIEAFLKQGRPGRARCVLDEASAEDANEILFLTLVDAYDEEQASPIIELASAKECALLLKVGENCAEVNGEDSGIAPYLPLLRARLEKLTLQALPQAQAKQKQPSKRL